MADKTSSKIRCFIAILLPEGVKEKAVEVQNKLRKANADVKWVEKENLHITLRFLGEIEEGLVEKVKVIMGEVGRKFPPPALIFKGVGTFPDMRRPRVIWVGGEAPLLGEIAEELEGKIRKLDIPPEKPFSFHLTLGRVRSPRNIQALSKAMQEIGEVYLGEFVAESFFLMRSILYPQGPQYTPIFEARFQGKPNKQDESEE